MLWSDCNVLKFAETESYECLVSKFSSDLEHFHKFNSPSVTQTSLESAKMPGVLSSEWHNAKNTKSKMVFKKKLWETPSPHRSEQSSLRIYSTNTRRERIQRLRRELILYPSPRRIPSSSQINLFSNDDTSIFA